LVSHLTFRSSYWFICDYKAPSQRKGTRPRSASGGTKVDVRVLNVPGYRIGDFSGRTNGVFPGALAGTHLKEGSTPACPWGNYLDLCSPADIFMTDTGFQVPEGGVVYTDDWRVTLNLVRTPLEHGFDTVEDVYSARHPRVRCHFCETYDADLGLSPWLAHMTGSEFREFSVEDLAIVLGPPAALDAAGRRAQGVLSLLGDSVLRFVAVDWCGDLGLPKTRAADVRSSCARWTNLSYAFYYKVPRGLVLFPPGTDPLTSRAGGDALLVIIGLVAKLMGMCRVKMLIMNLGLFNTYRTSGSLE